ncbi:hypothetical protein M5D96_008343 [Drosophila gunungcola]|uniref:Uncharacterized protein n=1 Tax=Drosophila gunungcola TaxID=103775 RepID=A0A9P9YKM3_9MUSC|nr:hypothetical protein M5D96_008343 [Drosophila gunungcola]
MNHLARGPRPCVSLSCCLDNKSTSRHTRQRPSLSPPTSRVIRIRASNRSTSSSHLSNNSSSAGCTFLGTTGSSLGRPRSAAARSFASAWSQ